MDDRLRFGLAPEHRRLSRLMKHRLQRPRDLLELRRQRDHVRNADGIVTLMVALDQLPKLVRACDRSRGGRRQGGCDAVRLKLRSVSRKAREQGLLWIIAEDLPAGVARAAVQV